MSAKQHNKQEGLKNHYQQKQKPVAETESLKDPWSTYDVSSAVIGESIGAVIQAQADHLADERFQRAQRQAIATQIGRLHGNRHLQAVIQQARDSHVPAVQRVVEIQPVRGNEEAFERRQELIDRLNGLSSAIQYSLEGNVLRCNVVDEGAMDHFDRSMSQIISPDDTPATIPLRIISGQATVDEFYVGIDYFDLGYVDIDDLLASDDMSLRMSMTHILFERAAVRGYRRRLGTRISTGEFNRAHRAGMDQEVALLRSTLNDDSIRYVFVRTLRLGGQVFVFRSSEGYRIFHIFRSERPVSGGEVYVMRGNERIEIEDFARQRAAVAEEPQAGP